MLKGHARGKTLLGTRKPLLEADFLVKGQDHVYQMGWSLSEEYHRKAPFIYIFIINKKYNF
jgi:hypothetical protein